MCSSRASYTSREAVNVVVQLLLPLRLPLLLLPLVAIVAAVVATDDAAAVPDAAVVPDAAQLSRLLPPAVGAVGAQLSLLLLPLRYSCCRLWLWLLSWLP